MMKQKNYRQSTALRFKRFAGKGYSAFNSMHRVINIGVVVGVTLTSAWISTAGAQNVQGTPSPRTDNEEETALEEVMVTASKVATPINQTAKLVSIISKREIAQSPIRSIQDLLVFAAGVDVAQRGGHGVQADISIRGGSFDQCAVLLNGINLTNAETGHLSYDIPINLSDIERIEIVRGSSALIYGSSAFSGGINIITKKSAHDRLYAQIRMGQHHSIGAEVRGAAQLGSLVSSLSLGYKSSRGHTDNTDYKIANALWQGHLDMGNENTLDLQLGYNQKAYGANAFYSPSGPRQYESTSSIIASVRGDLALSPTTRLVPMAYWYRSYDEYHWVRGTALNHHRTDHLGGNLILNHTSALGLSTIALEGRREVIHSNRLGTPMPVAKGLYTHHATRTNASLSLEHTYTKGISTTSGGVMINYNTLYERPQIFTSLSETLRLSRRWQVSISYSDAFRVPTFVDLYYVGPRQEAGSHIKPERSQSLELSTKYRQDQWDAYLTGFALYGTDIIDWVLLKPTDVKYRSINHGSINTYGIELGARLRLGNLIPLLGPMSQIRLDYVYMHQTHDSGGLLSLYAMRYLRDKLTMRLDHEILPRLSASWSLRYQKRMGQYDAGLKAGGASVWVGYRPFATLDLRLDYQIARGLSADLSINNLTSTSYLDYAAVYQPGLWASLGITYRLSR